MEDYGMTTHRQLTKADLRGYTPTVQEFILRAVLDFGLNYRLRDESVLLFPLNPNGKPIVAFGRKNSGRSNQIHKLTSWWRSQVEPWLSNEQLARLHPDAAKTPEAFDDASGEVSLNVDEAAEKLASVGYSVHVTPKPTPEVRPAALDALTPNAPADFSPSLGEWSPWVNSEGVASEVILTNGTRYLCAVCRDAGEWYEGDKATSVNMHWVGKHSGKAKNNLADPEVRAKGTKASMVKRKRDADIKAAVTLLAELCEVGDSAEVERLKKRLEKVEEDLAKATQRADEAEARLALIRESLKA